MLHVAPTYLRRVALYFGLLLTGCGAGDSAPSAPSNLSATAEGNKVILSWQDNSSDETGFSIYRQEVVEASDEGTLQQAGLSKIDTVTPNTVRYEDTFITPGTLYRYGVSADSEGKASPIIMMTEESPVTATNREPTADTQSVMTNEDVPVQVTLTGSDPDGDTLSFSIESQPRYGALGTLDAITGKVTYTPNKNRSGSDSFTYTVSDGELTSKVATVTLIVGKVNDAPVADPKEVSTPEDEPVTILLTGSDTEDEVLTFAIVTVPGKGSLSDIDQKTGEVVYTPNANENGTDTFTYTAADSSVISAKATVTINLGVVNDAPVAKAQQIEAQEDTEKVITLTADDADKDALTYYIVQAPKMGTLNGVGNSTNEVTGELSYTPNLNYNSGQGGPDSFTFKANDGADDSAPAKISITVNPVNDAPVLEKAIADRDVDEDAAFNLDVKDYFGDVDGDALSYTAMLADKSLLPTWLSLRDGNFRGTPTEADVGSYTIVVTASDEIEAVSEAFTLVVNPVNDAPTRISLTNGTIEENQPAGTVVGILGAIDSDSSNLTFSLVENNSYFDNASFEISDSNQLKTTRSFDHENENDQFLSVYVRVSDGEKTKSGIFTITVTNVEDETYFSASEIVTGVYHTCALDGSNKAYCWGYGYNGQLGDGNNERQAIPVPVSTPQGVNFSQLTAGNFHTCALDDDGNAYCWGSGSYGELGNGDYNRQTTPVAVSMPSDVSFSQLAGGSNHTCAIGDDNKAYCWGRNDSGQLGNGDPSFYPNTPTPVSMPQGVSFSQLAGGSNHTCAIGDDNNAYCWGRNDSGQLGNGRTSDQVTPVAVSMPSGVNFSQLAVGTAHTCALGSNGNAYCWGFNDNGQLGNGSTSSQSIPVLVEVPKDVKFSQLSAGGRHTCALGNDSNAYCWGSNVIGQLGDGRNVDQPVSTPVAVSMPQDVNFTQLAGGEYHTCALGDNDKTYCWGDNSISQLGNGGTRSRATPVAVLSSH